MELARNESYAQNGHYSFQALVTNNGRFTHGIRFLPAPSPIWELGKKPSASGLHRRPGVVGERLRKRQPPWASCGIIVIWTNVLILSLRGRGRTGVTRVTRLA